MWGSSKGRWETALNDEMRDHIERQTAANITAGIAPEEARRQAILQFGGLEGVREACREERHGFWLETLRADLLYGLRVLRQSPGFTAVAILTLALGIGANTAIFSVVNAVLLRSLPFWQPESLVLVWQVESAVPNAPLTGPDYLDFRSQNESFDDMSLFTWPISMNLSGAGRPEHVNAVKTQANFFDLLGSRPLLGRTFLSGDDQAGGSHVAVLSYRLWQSQFGGAADVVGKKMQLSGESYEVIGVMPPRFRVYLNADAWVPMGMDPKKLGPRGTHQYLDVGRLKPRVTPKQAEANLQAIATRLGAQYPGTDAAVGVAVVSLREQLVGDLRPALLVLLGAVALVLLIGCANVANLLLARASARRREIAVRCALGAGRFRLVRQLLTESLLLSVIAAGPGILLAVWGLTFLSTLEGVPIPRSEDVQLNLVVLVFAFGITAVTGILFGLAPAFAAGRVELTEELKSGAKGAANAGPAHHRLRDALVVGEIAVSLALLIGAGLLLRSFARLSAVDIGVRTEGVLTAKIALPEAVYKKEEQKLPFYRQLLERLEHAPGMDAAAICSEVPLEGGTNGYVRIEGQDPKSDGPLVEFAQITPLYFRALGIPFLAGRNFGPEDDQLVAEVSAASSNPAMQTYQGPEMVAIINRKMADALWPNQEPVGKKFSLGGMLPTRVIGVVGDVSVFSAREKKIAVAYFPIGFFDRTEISVVAYSSTAPAALTGTVRQVVASLNKDLPAFQVRTMKQVVVDGTADTRFQATLLGCFAALALVLAAVGIYGVASYLVAQRTHEIGIRMALGAQPGHVLRLVIGRGMAHTVGGLTLGLVGAFALTRLLTTLLFGVSPTDPITFGAVTALLGVVAGAACYIPARRAMRVDPIVALRYE